MPIVSHILRIEGLDLAIQRMDNLKGPALQKRVASTMTKALRKTVGVK